MIEYEGKINIDVEEFLNWVAKNYGPERASESSKLHVSYGTLSWEEDQKRIVLPFAASDTIDPSEWPDPPKFLIKNYMEPKVSVDAQELAKVCFDEGKDLSFEINKWDNILDELKKYGFSIERCADVKNR